MAEETSGSQGRAIVLTHKKTGAKEKRLEIIRRLWNKGKDGKTRSEIKAILKDDYGHEVAYQIVFAGTKPLKSDTTTSGDSKGAGSKPAGGQSTSAA